MTMNIAILNTNVILEMSKRGRVLGQLLQNEGRDWQQKINALEQKRQQIEQQLSKITQATNKDVIFKLERDRRNNELELTTARQRMELELNAQRQRLQAQIFDEIGPMLAKFAESKGIHLILNGPMAPLMYASKEADITQEFLAYYDSQATS